MERSSKFEVKLSLQFNIDLDNIFEFGIETFGEQQAHKYEHEIWQLIDSLSHNYLLFPECRFLTTKSKMYRWIILESHVIVYRITESQIEVLRMLHTKRSISEIKLSRKIQIDR